MILNDHLKLATINLPNVAATGNIGTAAATVDIASHIRIAQTTAGIFLALPNPTDLTAGHVAFVTNSGTVPFNMGATIIPPNQTRMFTHDGGVWRANDGKVPNPTLGTLATSGNITATTTNTATVLATTDREVKVEFRWNGNANAGAWSTWTVPALTGYTISSISIGWYSPTGFGAAAGAASMQPAGSAWTANTIYANLLRAITGFYLNVWVTYTLN